MVKTAVEHLFTGVTTPYDAYDSTETTLGKYIQQHSGSGPQDNYAGPMGISFVRPMEQTTQVAVSLPFAISISDTINWVFLIETGATANKRVNKYTHNKETGVIDFDGFITMTYAPTGNKTVRDFQVVRELYSTGTVAVSGSTVTGTTTAWATQKIAVGARIGFGSTDPTQITSWYAITAIGSNTSITLGQGVPGTIAGGTAYVIEELRIVTAITNATAANGGLFLTKGVSADDFTLLGTTIAAASTADLAKAVYWLADASTVLNTNARGMAIEPQTDVDTQYAYVFNLENTQSHRIYKYNIRATLASISTSKTTSAFVFRTGVKNIGTLNGSWLNTFGCMVLRGTSLYVPAQDNTSGIFYIGLFEIPLSTVTNGDTTSVSSSTITPTTNPTYSSTFSTNNSPNNILYISDNDYFVMTSTIAEKLLLNEFGESDSTPFGVNSYQLQLTTTSPDITPNITLADIPSIAACDGFLYYCQNGLAATTNIMYTLPISMHWDFAATDDVGRLITPVLDTTGATRFYRAYVNEKVVLGSDKLGSSPEPYRLYARTTGIADNSGGWTEITAGDLTGVTASDEIQLMFEFRIAGQMCVPACIYGVSVVYEDDRTDSHYQPSIGHSDLINKRFAWRFSSAFGESVPDLRVRLYNAETGSELVDDDTDTPTGTFERSTDDGQNWSAWNNTDKGNETTYIRYTPSSLTDDIKVRPLLTQL